MINSSPVGNDVSLTEVAPVGLPGSRVGVDETLLLGRELPLSRLGCPWGGDEEDM